MSTLMVIAKEPVPGRVKTRLSPPFTPQQAAALARASLLDTLEAVRRTPADHRVLVLDGKAGPWLPRRLHDAFTIVPQAAGTLDVRLAAAFATVASADPGPALLIGMDTPHVTADLLAKGLIALAADADADAVFGPAQDGGFWALGLREPAHPRVEGLLVGVPMSRTDTGRIQHDRLVSADLRISILQTLRDIDEAADARAAAEHIPGSRFAQLLDRIAPQACPAETDETTQRCPAQTDTLNPPNPPNPPSPPNPGPPETDKLPTTWSGPVSSGYERALWQALARQSHDQHAHNRSGAKTPCPDCLAEPDSEPIMLHCDSGAVFPLDVAKYAAAADAADNALLDRCTGPTLDIGCGPGRLAAALARRGVPSLGVDVTPVALLIARAAGATALCRSVFDRLPGEGRWPHALLIDGNIGIGGDPTALLTRIKDLLRPGGELVVETAAGDLDERHQLRFGAAGAPIPWASVGAKPLLAMAEPLGYRLSSRWEAAGRTFTALAT